MAMMNQEGYVAAVELDEDAGVLHGRVVNARAILTFEGTSVDELKRAFADTIADYKEWCRERGVEPGRPYSGTLSLRLSPDLHRRIAEAAAREGESINTFVADALERIA
jgi:predicted HicB family RNase H-like nuclease